MRKSNSLGGFISADIDRLMDETLTASVRGEIRLWASVFHGGIKEYCQALASGYAPAHPWIRWVESEEHMIGSFSWLCELYGFEPFMARRLITANQAYILRPSRGIKKQKVSSDEI